MPSARNEADLDWRRPRLADVIRRGAPAAFICAALLSGPALAQDEKAIEACHNKQSTLDIVACLEQLTAQWDKRLNTAYQAAMKNADADAAKSLRAAERAWLEFRKQRCYYLGTGPGTIGGVIAADCFMRMTAARAEQLVADARGLGPE